MCRKIDAALERSPLRSLSLEPRMTSLAHLMGANWQASTDASTSASWLHEPHDTASRTPKIMQMRYGPGLWTI
jgi:hypothetical protein